MKRVVLLLLLGGAAALAQAQPFPSRPIEIVNAFAPGGANDLNVRALQVPGEPSSDSRWCRFQAGRRRHRPAAPKWQLPAHGYKSGCQVGGLTAGPTSEDVYS